MDAHVKDGEAARCPMGFGKHGRANRDWWLNNLSVQRLNQHAPRSTPPLGADFDYAAARVAGSSVSRL